MKDSSKDMVRLCACRIVSNFSPLFLPSERGKEGEGRDGGGAPLGASETSRSPHDYGYVLFLKERGKKDKKEWEGKLLSPHPMGSRGLFS